mmetsp:Transcript_5803/g.10270  ORF Transcript_5803/g.10270 Transcript_5803/m.10270 type:complete len:191 (+) Transcript_5803:286-858(+)
MCADLLYEHDLNSSWRFKINMDAFVSCAGLTFSGMLRKDGIDSVCMGRSRLLKVCEASKLDQQDTVLMYSEISRFESRPKRLESQMFLEKALKCRQMTTTSTARMRKQVHRKAPVCADQPKTSVVELDFYENGFDSATPLYGQDMRDAMRTLAEYEQFLNTVGAETRERISPDVIYCRETKALACKFRPK